MRTRPPSSRPSRPDRSSRPARPKGPERASRGPRSNERSSADRSSARTRPARDHDRRDRTERPARAGEKAARNEHGRDTKYDRERDRGSARGSDRRDDRRSDHRDGRRTDRPAARGPRRDQDTRPARTPVPRKASSPNRGGEGAARSSAAPRVRTPRPMVDKSTGPSTRLRIDLYGRHAVMAAWLNPERRVTDVYLCDEEMVTEFAEAARARGVTRPIPRLVAREDLERSLPRGSVHQGIGLRCAPLPDVDLDDLIRSADNRPATCYVMLDQVTDPHNVGAILRSVSALGAHGVIVQKQNAPSVTAVLAKTACGAVETVPMVQVTNLSRTLEALKEADFQTLGLDERGEETIGSIHPQNRLVLVLGAEGDGLRRLVAENCDQLIRLPTTGAIGSLNVSNAAAVALYAVLASKTP